MIDCLTNRSIVDKVYVSSCCSAADPFASRDTKDDKHILAKLSNAAGNTQDMMSYVSTTDEAVCLIAIDYAGLSTNVDDLYQFVKAHDKLKKIIIDRLPFENVTRTFNRQAMLDNPSVLSVFKCRSKTYQRSKEM